MGARHRLWRRRPWSWFGPESTPAARPHDPRAGGPPNVCRIQETRVRLALSYLSISNFGQSPHLSGASGPGAQSQPSTCRTGWVTLLMIPCLQNTPGLSATVAHLGLGHRCIRWDRFASGPVVVNLGGQQSQTWLFVPNCRHGQVASRLTHLTWQAVTARDGPICGGCCTGAVLADPWVRRGSDRSTLLTWASCQGFSSRAVCAVRCIPAAR